MWFYVGIRVDADSESYDETEVFAALRDEITQLEIELNDGELVGITHFQPVTPKH